MGLRSRYELCIVDQVGNVHTYSYEYYTYNEEEIVHYRLYIPCGLR